MHRLAQILVHSYPIDYSYLAGYCDVFGVQYSLKSRALGDRIFWTISTDNSPHIHQFMMEIYSTNRRLFQTLLAEILRDAVIHQLGGIEGVEKKERKLRRLSAEMDLGLAPLGFAVDLKRNPHAAGGVDVILMALGTALDQAVTADLGLVLKTNYPSVGNALSAAYTSSGSTNQNEARSAMDQCRNALVNMIEDLSGVKWDEGGLDRISIGSSGTRLVKSIHTFLSGKGWAHGRDYPNPEEIWTAIRMTESCLIYLLWCTGKWSGKAMK